MELLTNYCVDLTKGKEIIAKNFSNWTSGNTIIDNFIQDKQINFDGYGTIFEWIPYNGLINIKERRNNCFATAIWKDGPLCNIENEWRRSSYEKVTLRFLYDMQNITDEFLNKVGSYLLPEIFKGGNFGITQNPDTKWTSGNTIIDNFIQDKQINFDGNGTVFEWIPYNDLIEIKEIEGCDRFGTAIWRDGPLRYDKKFIRNSSYDKVALIILYDLQNITDGFLNKVESYLLDEYYNYGMTQNPDTKFYILVFNVLYFEYYCKKCGNKYDNEYNKWCRQCQINHLKNNFTNLATSGDERIDDFIQKIQLKISECNDLVFEWIPYNELIETEEIDEDGFAIAIWKEGPLQYQKDFEEKLKRKPYYKVVLRFLHDLQNVTDEFLNKVESYFVKKLVFGISQNPNSKVYILIFNNYSIYCVKCGNKYESDEYTNENDKWCKACQLNHLKRNFANWTSNNEKIDNFIQKCQSKINKHSDTIFEWIPYNKFTNINEIRKSDFAIATWEDGPLCYSYSNRKYKRKLNEAVLLKYLYNSQHIDNTFLNKITYSMEGSYGISQNPNTKDFIFVLQQKYYCENCGNKYDNRFEMDNKNCILCQTNHENPKISVLLQEMRLYVNQNSSEFNMIFEWIPYDQFDNIEEIGNILFTKITKYINEKYEVHDSACISDLGLCRKIDDINEKNIYGVMPYVAPEVLKGKPYTQAADIYSFGMIMYVIATGKQPFANYAHDEVLALSICKGNKPEINDKIAPKCYIDLMNRCWGSNPDNRPNSIEIRELIYSFYNSLDQSFKEKEQQHYEIEEQFNETQEYRKESLLSIKNSQLTTHTQAVYSSRLLNSFTKNLSKYDDNINNTVEITDFTNL
ncbi:kinase-like domain-containing protein [Rhizophagus clarus]|uniref:Kinase-like domain-containing protein n=1 Tax=Rhizophagus clarus TaxID=94130 RepID=A0A8H3M0B8_9GLOM|nr:kinase-like domain-containing protein [Rhizophagus clarus]